MKETAPPVEQRADISESQSSLDTKNIKTVVFGSEHEFDAWYGCSSYFSEAENRIYAQRLLERLYVCDLCFKYSSQGPEMSQHLSVCKQTFKLPGKVVYQRNQYSIREIDGATDKCLSLFAKLFLDTKSIFFAVEGFKFYVLMQHSSSRNQHAVGFFSKEKLSWDDYNLACILVFPPYLGQGLGQLLISFSYQLSLLQGKIGSPEKPLSALGRKSYMAYWCTELARIIMAHDDEDTVSLVDISRQTAVRLEDMLEALKEMDAIEEIADGDCTMHVLCKQQILTYARCNNIDISTSPLIDSKYIVS
ncbi:acyl-CoA N-acyltransferase [Dipodascopsis tothii]|uniref:acyl-CoA N-acyltransferase n=1 Tax=Dipodascopsis tothii TaxID=44089 RepID=UPI0034CFB27D